MPKVFETIVSTKLKDLRVPISQNTTGRELFYKVVSHISLKEIWYFGLAYTDSRGDLCWLKLNKKVLIHDLKLDGSVIRFRLLVKFYPEDLNRELIQLVTQKLFFLQAREAVLEDEIYCPTEKAVLLASLSCQAEFGEYKLLPPSGRFLMNEKLLPDRVIIQYKLTKNDWDRRITELWKRHGDMHSDEAMTAYLKIVQDLEMFGVTYFEVENKKGSNLWLGIDAFGLHIYERGNKLTPKVGFPWSEIKTLSFSNRRFIIKPIEKKSPDFIFSVSYIGTNKRILALSMGNHELYMRRRRPEPVEIVQMKEEADKERKLKREERMTLQRERKERMKAQEINKQLEEKAAALEMSANQAREALERERNNNVELDKRRALAERENEKYKEKNRRFEREKNKIYRELNMRENENEYLRNKFSAVNVEMQRALQEKEARDQERAEQEALEMERRREENGRQTPDSSQGSTGSDVEAVLNSPVRGHHALYEPDEVDGESTAEHDLQVMSDDSLPQYDRKTTMDTYIQSYLEAMGRDIFPELKRTKLTNYDHINAANIQAGRTKFNTLKRIRMGHTKQRIDQFECM